MNLRNKIFAFVLIALNIGMYSQNSKWNIKLSGGAVTDVIEIREMNVNHQLQPSVFLNENVSNFGAAVSYQIFKDFYGGVYGSYSTLTGAKEDVLTGIINSHIDANAVFYGLELSYQILPLFFEKPTRFDLYTISRIGNLHKWWKGYDNIQLTEKYFEVGAGLGAAINFTTKFGVFGEVLIGRFYYSNTNWRAGLCLKL